MTNIVKVKTGGRCKGTPNKATKAIKESVALALAGHFEKLDEYIELLEDPRDKLAVMIKLAPYVMSKEPDEIPVSENSSMIRFDQKI